MRPTMGGLAVWLIGAPVFLLTGHLGVFSLGYDDLSLALDGDLGWQIAAILLGAKLLATVLSYGLGGCGGIFSPTLFFGGTAGAMMAGLVGLALPLTHGDEVTLAIVGMAACLGGVVRAPITGILIVFEMTHDFALVPALMVGALVSQGVSRLITPRNFYEELLEQDGHHVERVMPPRSLRHWLELPVGRIANFAPVALTDLSSTAISRALAEHRFQRFPVVLGGKLAGVVSRAALRATVRDGTSPALDEDVVTCTPDTRLREAEIRIIDSSGHFAVVVDRRGPDAAVLGVLTLHDLLRAEIAFAREHED